MASSKNGKTPKPRAKKADNGPQNPSVQAGLGTDSEDGIGTSSPQPEVPVAIPADGTKAGITVEDSPATEDGSTTSTNQQASSTPFPTEAHREGTIHTDSTQATDGSTLGTTTQANPAAFPTADTSEGRKDTDTTDGSTTTATQITDGASDNEMGDVASLSAVAESPVVYSLPDSLPTARVRDNETKSQCRERLRQEARTAGMTRRESISYAYRTVEQVWIPPPEPEAEATEPEFLEEPEAVAIEPEPEEPPPQPIPSDQGVPGLGTIPEDWPKLAANASLQAEIAWVSANRLLVRDGSGVDLSRALSPAPSYSALSWLETSILFPSKFADISVKATQNQEDEAQHIRREKLAIDEIRALLAEMMEE